MQTSQQTSGSPGGVVISTRRTCSKLRWQHVGSPLSSGALDYLSITFTIDKQTLLPTTLRLVHFFILGAV